jgi:hypothetical protein
MLARDLSALGVESGIKDVVQRNAIFDVPRADIHPRFRRECRQIAFHSR